MSQTSDNIMKQLHFVMRASRYFMFQNKQPISGQKRVLAVLKLEDGLTQNYLAEILALKPGSLAELLKKMEIKDVIKRETDAQDKRVKRVYLTEEGKKAAAQIDEAQKEEDTSAFFAGLTDEEQETFSKYLEKIVNGWDEDLKQETQKFIDPECRIKAMAKWREYAENNNFSIDELKEFRDRMHGCHHHHGPHHEHGCRNFDENYCNFDKKEQYTHDFWRKFWHNEDDEI